MNEKNEKTDPEVDPTGKIYLPVEVQFRERIQAILARRSNPDATEREVAAEALNIGLNALEGTLKELENKSAMQRMQEQQNS